MIPWTCKSTREVIFLICNCLSSVPHSLAHRISRPDCIAQVILDIASQENKKRQTPEHWLILGLEPPHIDSAVDGILLPYGKINQPPCHSMIRARILLKYDDFAATRINCQRASDSPSMPRLHQFSHNIPYWPDFKN